MKKIFFCMAVTAMMLYACSTGTGKQKIIGDSTYAAAGNDIASPQSHEAVTHENWDKKIIKTAEVNLSVKNYQDYDRKIHNSVKGYGAYIAKEEQASNDLRKSNVITIKVPVEQFEPLLNSLSGDSITVLEKRISSEEVTGEMVDTQSRIQAKKQMRERYLELLKQAKNMKEILEVQQEINTIQESIESAGGRLNYLQHQTAYSTIELSYFQYTVIAQTPPGKVMGYLIELKNAFLTGIRVIAGISVCIVALWPLLLIAGVIFVYWKRNKAKAI